MGKGNGTFYTQKTYSLQGVLLATTSATSLIVGDFNGDGIPDLAVTQSANLILLGTPLNGVVDVMLGDGTGKFPSANVSQFTVGILPSSVVTGDFNGDSNLDFAVTNKSDNTISVMLGDGSGTNFNQASGSPTGTGTSPTAMAVADFNNDAVLDLAVVDSGQSQIGIYKGNGDGSFTLQTSAPATGTTPLSIVAGDFNSDGTIDLAVTNSGQSTASLLLGNGDLTFQSQTTASVGTTPSGITAGDFNGDGAIDLAVANSGSCNVSILLNQLTETASASFTGISIPGSGSSHLIDATYAGETNTYSTSTSNTVSLASTPIKTSTLLSVSTATPSPGQQVVITATLEPSLVGSLAPSGTENITFTDNGVSIGTALLSSGSGTLDTTTLASGPHSIVATYAGDTNFATSFSLPMTITVGKVTPAITWATPASISYGMLLSSTQLNATASVAGSFSYSYPAYTLLTTGSYPITATFTPTNTAIYNTATATVTLVVSPATSQISWAAPAPITYGTALSGIQLDASVAVYNMVPLSLFYNVSGIYTDGSKFTTGFDGGVSAYSSNLLGTSVTWNNVTYQLGPTNAPDAVSNTTISLPAGHYAGLTMLGALVNNATAANTFVVTYTDGTTASVTQSLSDWVYPLNYSGETEITCVPYRDESNGGEDAHLTCVYGYQIPLDSTKIVQSIQLPQTRNVVMLAMALVSPPVPGTLTYNPAAGAVLPTGANTLSAVFTPTDSTNYTSASASVLELVNPANSTTLVWPTPAPITYGTALSSTQLDAVAQTIPGTTSVSLSPYYRVNAFQSNGSIFSTGGFDNNGNAYSSNLVGSSIVWAGQTYLLGPANLPSAVTSTTIALPQGNFVGLSLIGAATTTGQTPQLFTVTYTDGATTTANLSMSSWTQSANYTDETIVSTTGYQNTGSGGETSNKVNLYGYQISLISSKTVQSVTLPNNRNIVIAAMSLNTSSTPASVPGTYAYTPPAGTVPAVGTIPLSVVFTPTNTNYGTAAATVNLVVGKQALLVTSNPETAVFGTTVPAYTYTMTGFVVPDTQASAVTGAPALKTTPAAPVTVNTYPIVASLGSLTSSNYSFTFANNSLTITPATPIVTWATPGSISYGTALSGAQLNATASVGGTFSYSPAAGNIPAAGMDTLSVTFTPTDSVDYVSVTQTVSLKVNQTAPVITWATPAAVPYGTALSTLQLDATASVPGVFSYSPALGNVPAAGTVPLTVTFTPNDATDYTTASKTVQLVVTQVIPTIAWANPATITYGTALSATQLNATASVPGTLTYSPVLGSIPTAGTDTLNVTFAPTDATDYTTATKSVQLVVTQVTPTITWANPTSITYGTALSAIQLNATASVPGAFAYSPASGSIPIAGTDTLNVTFTPTDATDYTTTAKSVQLVVNQAVPVLTWANPASITYGATLSAIQLNAAATVPGSFAYAPAAGTTPAAGTDTLSVTFTPTDATDYTTATKSVQLVVNQAVPVLTWANPASITYGTALSALQLNASASVSGSFVYSPAAGSIPTTGTDSLTVTFTPADATDYTTATKTVQIVVTQATPVITWATPAAITYGTALSALQLDATASVPGTLVYSPAVGSVPTTGTDTLTVTFTPTDTTNYTTATKSVSLVVNQALPVVTWSNPAFILYDDLLANGRNTLHVSVGPSFHFGKNIAH